MSRERRRKRQREKAKLAAQNRIVATLPPIEQSGRSAQQSDVHPLLRWTRSVAGPGACVAGLELINIFWLGASLFSVGIIVTIIDVLLEPWMRRHRLTQIPVLCGLVLAGAFIETKVIFRSAPIIIGWELIGTHPVGVNTGGILWNPDMAEVRFSIENPTDTDDYEDLDVTVRIDHPDGPAIIAAGQVSNIPNVDFPGPGVRAMQEIGGPPILIWESATGHTKADKIFFIAHAGDNRFTATSRSKPLLPIGVIATYQRIRCSKLPHRETLDIALALSHEYMPKDTLFKMWVKGQYTGGHRTRPIDKIIPIGSSMLPLIKR